jgi:pyruvate dehydrogenase E2 component (dihydrolipoamide acetyltransferase)
VADVATPPELVLVPRVTANDDQATLVAWSSDDGARVAEGAVICELEYSKSVVEVTATHSGWLFRLHERGAELPVGKPVAMIADSAERPAIDAAPSAESLGIKISAKARVLIERHGLDPLEFQGLGIVKQKHVEEYLAGREPAEAAAKEDGVLHPLTPIRRRTAAILTESVRTTPHSWLVHWLSAETVEARLEAAGRDRELKLGLFDLVVAAVARAAALDKKANSSWRGDGIFEHAGVHLGFALNQPDGELLVPVIRDADRLELVELVGRIRGLQKAALRHKLTPEELSGGTVTVTSLLGTGVHQITPILVPGQAAIVAIADRCRLAGSAAYALTLGFDHRVLNGAEAAEFLAIVAAQLTGEGEHE